MINLPNTLTLFRMFLVFPFLLLVFQQKLLGAFIFLIAALTDFLDGKLARIRGEETILGRFLDPLGDKIIVSGALLSLFFSRLIPLWMVIVIILREFLVTFFRVKELRKGRILESEVWGKLKTGAQMGGLTFILFLVALDGKPMGEAVLHSLVFYLVLFILVITLISGISFFKKHFFEVSRNL